MQTDKWSVESLKKDFKGVYSTPITEQDPVLDPTCYKCQFESYSITVFCNLFSIGNIKMLYIDQKDIPRNTPQIPPTSEMKLIIVYFGFSSVILIVLSGVWVI